MDSYSADKILGDSAPAQLRCVKRDAGLDSEVQRRIAETFNTLNAARGGAMTNGAGLRVLGYNNNGDIHYSLSDYATFRLYDEGLIGDDVITLPRQGLDHEYGGFMQLAVSGGILSSDGHWMLGQRAQGRQFPNAWEFCTSGGMTPDFIKPSGDIDFHARLMDLMQQETGLERSDVVKVELAGVYQSSVVLEPLYCIRAARSSEEIREKFQQANDQYTALKLVHKDDLQGFIDAQTYQSDGKIAVVSTSRAATPDLVSLSGP